MRLRAMLAVVLTTLLIAPAASAGSGVEPVVSDDAAIVAAVESATEMKGAVLRSGGSATPNVEIADSGTTIHARIVERPILEADPGDRTVMVAWPSQAGAFLDARVLHGALVVIADDGSVARILDLGVATPTPVSIAAAPASISEFEGESAAALVWPVLCTVTAFEPTFLTTTLWGETLEVCSSPVYIDLTSNLERSSSAQFGWNYDATFGTWLSGDPKTFCSPQTNFYGYKTRASVVISNGVDIASASDISEVRWFKCWR